MVKEIIFPPLEDWQQPVYDALHDQYGSGKIIVTKAKRQVGKSCTAVVLLIEYALTKPCINAIVEPTLNQSRRVYKQIVSCLEGTGAIKSANAQLLSIDLTNGSEIVFKSAEQRDSLRGFTVTGLLVLDEAAFIMDDIFELLFPWVDAHSAPILMISTPLFCDGIFYTFYNKGLLNIDNTYSFDWSLYDTSKYLSPEKLEMYRQTLSPNKFKSEYLGEFIEDGSYVFGNVRDCIGESMDIIKFAGIDWATGNNGDYTVVTLLGETGNIVKIEAFNNMEPSEQVNKIASILNNIPTIEKVQVELNSIGAVFHDYLKKALRKNITLIGFNTTNDSKRRIIEQLVAAFNQKQIIIPDDRELITELQHYAVEKTSKGYTYNGLSGFHDDYVMSLAIGYDLTKQNKNQYSVSTYKRPKHKSLREIYG